MHSATRFFGGHVATLAGRVAEHPQVARVRHPGLKECDPAGLVGTQMAGPRSLLAFERPVAAEARPDDALLRLSVGLEDVDDLWADLEAALG